MDDILKTLLESNSKILKELDSLKNIIKHHREEQPPFLRSTGQTIREQYRPEKTQRPPNYSDGHFRVRESGLIEYRFKHIDGKTRSVYGRTKAICYDKRTELIMGIRKIKTQKAKLAKNEVKKETPITYDKLLNDLWLPRKYKQDPPLSKSHLSSIERVVRLHIPKWLKATVITEITEGKIRDALNQVKSSRMREYTITVYSESLAYAKAHAMITLEPWKFKRARHKPNSRRPLEDNEYKLLISKAPEHIRRLIIGYCWTGCRRNELLTLTYGDIENETIKVWDKKTKKYKFIPLLPPLAEVIGSGKPNEPIFKFSPGEVNNLVRELCDSVGLTDISPHNLRHTFGSVLYDAGVDLKTIQLWLGHNTLKVTEELYTKRRKAKIAEDTQKIKEHIFSTTQSTT